MILSDTRFLEHRPGAVIRVTGDDAFAFLQGQFTNELRQAAGTVVYGLWLDQKGKVLADSQVLGVSENEFLIISDWSTADNLRRRLENYIVADDVTLVDETTDTHGLVVLGGAAGEAIGAVMDGLPSAHGFVRRAGALAFRGRRTAAENFAVIGGLETVGSIRGQLQAAGATPIDPVQLEFSRIEGGVPRVPVDIGPGDLPNEAGLETVAISYTKGCYLGQEVMARLKNLGQVRRRLHVVRGHGIPPGGRAALYQAEKKVGETRSVAAQGDAFVALAMLSLVNLNPGAGLSLEPNGAPILGVQSRG